MEVTQETLEQQKYKEKLYIFYIGSTIILLGIYLWLRSVNIRQEIEDEAEVDEEFKKYYEYENTNETDTPKEEMQETKKEDSTIKDTQDDYWEQELRKEAHEYKKRQEKTKKFS